MILLVTEVFPPMRGGSGRWLWELYRRLPAGSVRVAAPKGPGADEFDRTHELSVERMPLRFDSWGLLNRRGLGLYAGTFRRLHRLAREVRPSVVHCGKALPDGFLGWMLRQAGGPPYWCYVHGEELTLARTSRQLLWMTRRVLNGAARVIANSQHTRGLL